VLGLLLYLKAKPYLPPDKRDLPKPAVKETSFEQGDGARIAALLALVPAIAIALLPNQEIFNAYLVWADQHFDLVFFGTKLPTSWMITVDSAMSFLVLVGITWFWKWWGDSGRWEPDELGKLIIGSVFTIGGALCLYMAALTQGDGKIGLFWPVMFHFLNSLGFGHVLPVSLALVTKIAPRKMTATSVGIYYLAFFLANYVVGKVGGWYSTMPTPQFWLVHVGAAVIGLVAFVVFKLFLSHRFSDEARATN